MAIWVRRFGCFVGRGVMVSLFAFPQTEVPFWGVSFWVPFENTK